jgi:hypothetical protein
MSSIEMKSFAAQAAFPFANGERPGAGIDGQ